MFLRIGPAQALGEARLVGDLARKGKLLQRTGARRHTATSSIARQQLTCSPGHRQNSLNRALLVGVFSW
jgi:hypothetical protein